MRDVLLSFCQQSSYVGPDAGGTVVSHTRTNPSLPPAMSRRPSRWTVLFRIGLVCGVVYALLPDKVASVLVSRDVPAEVTMSRAATVYLLRPHEWSTFQVPPSQLHVKIISNAGVAATATAAAGSARNVSGRCSRPTPASTTGWKAAGRG